MTEVIESTATEETMPVPAAPPATLFRTDDPVEALVRAKATADALASVIRDARMVKRIGDKDYLLVEAWQTLGAQVGVTPVIVSTRQLSEPDGWEARCEARHIDGRVLGAADSMCLKTEERWKDSEEFELRSMAQTRAMSRALASVLRFIPTLAGFSGTPAEEMSGVEGRGGGGRRGPSEKQLGYLNRLIDEKLHPDEADAVRALVPNLSGQQVSKAIEALKEGDVQVKAQLVEEARAWIAKQGGVEDEMPADKGGLEPSGDDQPWDEAPDDLPPAGDA